MNQLLRDFGLCDGIHKTIIIKRNLGAKKIVILLTNSSTATTMRIIRMIIEPSETADRSSSSHD
jgi:hypothetical protein